MKINITRQAGLTIVGFSSVILTLGISVFISWILYQHTVSLLTDNLKERLKSIVTTASVNFQAEDLEALRVESDWKKPAWPKIVNQMKKIRLSNNDILFAYIFRKKANNPNEMEFVADSHSINPYANTDENQVNDVDVNYDGLINDADTLQWPGQNYDSPPEEAVSAYLGATTNKDLYEDSYGKVITGYAPIKDKEGKVIAVFAIDIRANDFSTITTQTLYPFLIFIVGLVILVSILAVILISIWNKRIALIAELDRQKDELLSMVSHQLATPVSSVKWYVEMMLDGDMGKLTSKQQEHLQSVQSVAADLSDLVSLILDVSRIQLGRMKVDKNDLDLSEFFKEVLVIIEPKAKEKPINLSVSLPKKMPVVKLDRRYTHMTIENLLTNAIKYTPKNGDVQFSVEIKNNTLYCKVKDTGVGIPKQEQSKIFGKLFRATNVRNTFDGNGFGLYVAKGAIEAQGGKIWFESEEGRGSTFFVELPI